MQHCPSAWLFLPFIADISLTQVRDITGETYMLNQDEELWSKELPPAVEALIGAAKDPLADRSDRRPGEVKARDKTRVITFRVPHNAAVQIYDYKEKKARFVPRLYTFQHIYLVP